MRKANKIVLAYILSPLVIRGVIALRSYVVRLKIEAVRNEIKAFDNLEEAAKNYATAEVLKMTLRNEPSVQTKEGFMREWRFAYMNYRAHH